MSAYYFVREHDLNEHEKELCVEHRYDLASNMHDLRKSGKFCDITFHTKDNKDICAHKVVVAGFSTYFVKMLSNDPDQKIFNIDYSGSVIEMAIDFIYTGVMYDLELEDVVEMFDLARFLDSEILGHETVRSFHYIIDERNALEMYELFSNRFKEMEDIYDVMTMIEEKIANEIETLWNDARFKQLISSDSMFNIMNCDYLDVKEDAVIDIILDWLTEFPGDKDLIRVIRWNNVSQDVREKCKMNPLFNDVDIDKLSKYYIDKRDARGIFSRYY
ncbi:kelch-containing protein [Akhmeta virus]|uniref:BTB Kelch-domain containing protein n=1 Tax=Orthopoxvirus akhmetapox TaxID=2200830 RepID=A0A346FR99_9POXV|nr:kelch-containing protein [Akhmeta virus]AXN74792.1 kelch-containing protein [Akhmeta virus]AXN75012.1 kelch-containing protein [Akhmeta virus]QEQ49344.1 BTB Kelch-domain containing protein [Akhmeta virus]